MRSHSTRTLKTIFAVLAVLASADATAFATDGAAGSIYVPSITIYPGDEITDDVLVERKVVSAAQAASFGSQKENIVGKIARRTLIPGQPIPVSALRGKEAVMQGRSYDIVYKSGALTISGSAVPMKSAAVGETVSVRNPETGIIVQAVVQAGGTLLVKSR
ncbi:MAG TPA: flagellar basal body P-ring formation chaperone FlgA [Hyphomicrobium sp.]|nr:flagellar basal body P-ring formation chaperone FlgA [Hyphomicrobium sp.]